MRHRLHRTAGDCLVEKHLQANHDEARQHERADVCVGDGDAAERTAQEAGRSVGQADLADRGVVDTLDLDADIVANNAGLQRVAPVQELPPERFPLMLRVLLGVTLGASLRVRRAVRTGYVRTRWSNWGTR